MLESDVRWCNDGFYGTSDNLRLSLEFNIGPVDFAAGCVRPRSRLLTQTLVGGVPSGPGPGSIPVKRVTSLAVISDCVMLTGADQATMFPLTALAGVTVTLTSEGNTDT